MSSRQSSFLSKSWLVLLILLSVSSSFGENRCVDLFLPDNVVLFPRAFKPPVIFKESKFVREIFAAMEDKNFAKAQQMLRANHFKFINTLHPQTGLSILHYATDYFNFSFAQFLLQNGANPNIKNAHGQTALHVATITGHRAFVELLLAHGADVNAKDLRGNTPMANALEISLPGDGFLDIFLKQPLLDVNSVNADGLSLVHISLRLNIPFYALQLMQLGADVNSADPHGRTPLHWAAIHDNVVMAGYLIKQGADLDAKDNQDMTAMDYAREEQNTATLTLISRAKKK